MCDYSVYIDESGDLGVGVGTEWFVITAVIVKKENEKFIRQKIDSIKTKLNIKEIHFHKISDFYKKAYIVRELNCLDFIYMNVIVNTKQFDKNKIPSSLIAYNYSCKYLLQRVSQYLAGIGGKADIILSGRGTSRDGELIEYIKTKLLPYPKNNINQNYIEKVYAKSASEWDLLQLADVCATTTFLSIEQNQWGFCVPCFYIALKNHLFQKNGSIDGFGIKYFQDEMRPDQAALKEKYICAKKEGNLGATST